MSAKYYAIHKGRVTGIFQSWDDAKPHISGFSGPKFKKFDNLKDAEYYVKHGKIEAKKDHADAVNYSDVIVFTDGSFSNKTKKSGIGIYFQYPYTEYSVGERVGDGSTNQFTELYAIAKTILIIKEKLPNHFNKTNHSNISVEVWTDSDYSKKCIYNWYPKWVKNGWKTASGGDVLYKEVISFIVHQLEEIPYDIKIRHIKEVGLKSHQGEPDDPIIKSIWKGNKEADKLAQNAL